MSPPPETRVTLCLRKGGTFLFLGHRDVAQTLSRALRRSGLPLQMTQGFHPHVRMVLPEPLPLGVGSDCERYVVYLKESWEPQRVAAAVRPCLPAGCDLLAVKVGAQRDVLDAPVDLEIDLEQPVPLGSCLEAGALGLRSLEIESIPNGVKLRLVPPSGRRPSLARVLRAVEAAGGTIRSATRRVRDSGALEDCAELESP